jgi:hypothetical protein
MMRAEVVHITDHAILRWSQRVTSDRFRCADIRQAIKNSKVLRKNDPLPLPRLDGSVYSLYDGVLFVLEPITIDEYRLVTVVSEFSKTSQVPRKISKEKQQLLSVEKRKTLSEKLKNKRQKEEEHRGELKFMQKRKSSDPK